ncbi:MAG: acyloxyacyl hydrolase [Candidatus Acidiferrales bacterium]
MLPPTHPSKRNHPSPPQDVAPAEARFTRIFELSRCQRFLALATLLFAALALAPSARAQGDTEFGVWGGYSLGTAHAIGITSDRQLGVVALRYGHAIYDWPSVSLAYTLDVVPVEVVHQPTYVACNTNPNNFPEGFCQSGHETVYGGGINPLGLKLNFFRQHRLQLYGASTAGFVASVRPVPVDVPGGTQFNFDFDFQAGFQLFNSSRSRAWTLGYKFQHISNAYRHSFNPGVDLNLIYIGYSFFR